MLMQKYEYFLESGALFIVEKQRPLDQSEFKASKNGDMDLMWRAAVQECLRAHALLSKWGDSGLDLQALYIMARRSDPHTEYAEAVHAEPLPTA